MNTAAKPSLLRRAILAVASFSMLVQPVLADYQFQVPLEPQTTGAAGGGALSYSEQSFDFGAVYVNSNASHTFTLTNTGTATIALNGISVSGGGYSKTSTCGDWLEAGASCTIAVKFAPTAAGTSTGTVTINSDDVVPTRTLGLTGRGKAGTLTFEGYVFTQARQVSDPVVYQDLPVSNNTSAPVRISGVSVTSGEDSFSQVNTCEGTLNPGASCLVRVGFSPAAPGTRNGTVTVLSDSDESPNIVAVQGTGVAASGELTVASFGTVQVGEKATRAATLTNKGIGFLTVGGLAVSGSDYKDTTGSLCPVSLPPAGTCTFDIEFAPSAAGPRAGQASATTGAGVLMASLDGIGQSPSASFSIDSFGSVNAGASATKTATLRNTGLAAISVGAPQVSGTGFTFNGTTCGASLAAGASCDVTVLFSPLTQGAATGTLTVPSGAGPQTAALSGTGMRANLALAPNSIDMGSQQVGTTGVSNPLTLTNNGNLAATGLTLDLPSGYGLDASSTCAAGATLAAGASCTVVLSFTPALPQAYSGTLTAATAAANGSTVSASVTGTGIKGLAGVSPSSLTFAAQQVGTSSASKVVTVTNSGSSVLTFTGVSIVDGASDFAQSNNCGSVPVNGTCSINVAFTPASTGARSGTLALTHDGDGVTVVALSGDGRAPSASLTAGSFASTQVGASVDATAVLTNTGVGSITLTPPAAASVSGTDFSFVSTTCSGSLAAGASCNVVVRFTPTASATRSGTVSVATQAGTQTAALNAVGTQGAASLDTASLVFAAQQVGTASATKTVALTNTGTAALTISGVAVTAGSAEFSHTTNCASVPVGGGCTIVVTFTPNATGARTGTLTLTHNGTGATSVSLSGTGQSASATMSSPAFADTKVGGNTTATATLTNTGIGAISVTVPTTASVTGTDFTFSSTTCGSSLAAGASCNVVVGFAPTAKAARTGTLSFATGAGTKSASLSANGIQGTASLSASSLAFSSQQVGTTSTAKTITVTNTGNSTLTVSLVDFTSGAAEFSQTNTCASALAVNGTCTISVTFSPSASGSRTGTLRIQSDSSAGAATVALTGTGQDQMASLSVPSFAATSVGSSSTAVATLTNDGVGPLSVTVPTAASVSGTDFSFVSTTCSSSVAVGASCGVTVRFSPTSTTARSGTLSVTTGAGVKSVALGSTGIQGYAAITPASLTYSAQQVGTSSAVQTVTVTNTGTDVLTFTGVSVTTGASDFGQSNNCGAVPVNGTCTVNVSFTPSASGSRPGTLTFVHNGGGMATVSLTGTGQAASGTLGAIAFGNVKVNSSSTLTSTLTNTGIGPLSLTTPSAASVTGTDFSFVSTTCGTSLATSTSCTVSVKFQPTTNVARSGSLSVSTGAGTLTGALSGTGIQGTASYSVSSMTFAAQQVSTTSASQSVTITNTGSTTLTISAIDFSAGATDYSQSNTCASPLAVNGTCVVAVFFTPTAAGTRTGTLRIQSDASNGNGSVALTGTGQSASASVTSSGWGSAQVGDAKAGYQTVTNTGVGPITFPSAPSVNAPFAVTTNGCSGTLAAGASCNINMTFTPSAATSYTQTLSVPTSAGTLTSTSTGTGVSPSLAAITAASAGTNLPPQTTSGTFYYFQNTGIGNVTINGTPYAGGSAAVYSVASGSYCYNGLVLAPNASCMVYGYFNQAVGSYSGTLNVPSTAGTVTQTITATVTGALTAATTAYGSVNIGSTLDKTVAVTNTTSVTSRAMTYAATAPFSIVSNACGTTLASGASCNVTVRFTPTSQTAVSGNYLTVTGQFDRMLAGSPDSGSPSSSQTYYGSLSGTGTQAVTSVSPSSVAFGSVQVGQTATSGTITLSNTGNIAASLTSVTPGSGYSIVNSTCGTSIAASSSCTFQIRFSPTAVSAYNNNTTAAFSNASNQTVTVTGSGVAPALAFVGYANGGSNTTLGTIGVYSDSGRWPIYQNNGSGPVVIQSHTATGGFWAWLSDGSNSSYCYAGQVLAPGAQCITFNGLSTSGLGAYSGASTMTYVAQGQSTQYTTGVSGFTATVATTTSNQSSLAFGTQAQNTWSGALTVRLTNNASNNPLRSVAVSISGANSGNFRVSSNGCSAGIAAGGYCDISVQFNPTASANGFAGTLNITGGYPRMEPGESGYIPTATGVSFAIPLSGNGAFSQAVVTTTATSQSFGGGWYGQGWSYLNWYYRNDGNSPMTLANPPVSAPMGVSSNSCTNVAPGADCVIQVYNTWSNENGGTQSQSWVASGATIAPPAVTTSYITYSAVPTWGTTSLAFGTVNVGSSSTQGVTLYNYGVNTPYNWAANNGVANLPAGFTMDTSNCSSVAAGAGNNAQGGSCTVYVTFTPTAASSYSGSNIYLTAASRLNNTLSVSGTGASAYVNPTITGTLDVSCTTCTSRSFTATLNNPAGNPTITLSSITVSGGASITGGTCAVNGTVAGGSTCTVTFTRSGINSCGYYSGALTIGISGRSSVVKGWSIERTAASNGVLC